MTAVLENPVALDPERPEYMRVSLSFDGERNKLVCRTTGGQRSSRLLSMRSANGLMCVPQGQKGKKVEVLRIILILIII